MILTSAAVLVIALTVPAIGEETNWFGTASGVKQKSKRALKKAKKAKRKARQANKRAKAANRLGEQVQRDLDSTRIVSDKEAGVVGSTAPIGRYQARGGPSVQVTVPSSGLIEVWAQADIRDDEGGAVALFEDGRPVPNISDEGFCGDDSALIDMQGGGPGGFDTFSTPPLPGLLGCTSGGAAGPVILERAPGPHTFELRYSSCSCGGSAEFRNRVLRIGPRL